MRYCMNFYLNWHRNCERSMFEQSNLLNKKCMFNFDLSQFFCQLRQKFVQYLISKLHSMLKYKLEDQSVMAHLHSKMALSIWADYYIKLGLFKQELQALYMHKFGKNLSQWLTKKISFYTSYVLYWRVYGICNRL